MIRSLSQSSAKELTPLEEVKKARKQLEQDASLLANRIRLLQSEESRTQKRIDQLKRKSALIQQVHSRKEMERRAFRRIKAQREQQAEAARQRFNSLRTHRTAERFRQMERIWQAKKEVYTAGRAERENALHYKEEITKLQEERNREMYLKVKEVKTQPKKRKLRPVKSDYEAQIQVEEEKTAEKRNEVARMEQLEMELLSRLRFTQSLEQEAVLRLERAARGVN